MDKLPELVDSKKRWNKLLAEPNLLDIICAHIANGGTPVGLAKLWDLPFGWISNWLNSDEVRGRRYAAALLARGEWARETVISELQKLSLVDIRLAYDDKGELLPPKQWPDALAAAVTSLETDELFEGTGPERVQIGVTRKLKLIDKARALELWGKHLRLFIDQHVVASTKLEDMIAASYAQPQILEPTKELEDERSKADVGKAPRRGNKGSKPKVPAVRKNIRE